MYSSITNEKTTDGFQIIQKSYSHEIKLIYSLDKCAFCGICENICPKNAIIINKEENSLLIDENKCVRCGLCSYFCMFHALSITQTTLGSIEDNKVIMHTLGGIPDLESNISIDKEKCNLCGSCEKACPVEAIKVDDKEIEILPNTCIKCGWCASICPQNAIEVKKLFEGTLQLNKKLLNDAEIEAIISTCKAKCFRYKNSDSINVRNVKTKKILNKEPDELSWLEEFCIYCGACKYKKPDLIQDFKRSRINVGETFLENKMWNIIKEKLLK